MGLKRKMAGGVAAVSAATLPFAIGVPGAAAIDSASASRTFDHSFRNFSGQTITCTVDGFSALFRQTSADPTYDGFAATTAYGSAGCEAFASITATYRNPSGLARVSNASGRDFANLSNDDVATDYVVTHRIFFDNCAENCEVTFQTKPK